LKIEFETVVFPQLMTATELVRSRNCPPISIVLLRILKTTQCLTSKAHSLLYSFCQGLCLNVIKNVEYFNDPCKPYEPLLLKDALHCLTVMTIEKEAGVQKYYEMEKLLDSRVLLDGLGHKVSEVREGILNGCLQCITFDEEIQLTDEKKNYLFLVNNFFSKFEVMSKILNAACIEKEPDVMQYFFEFLCRFIRSAPLSSLALESKQLFLEKWDSLYSFISTSNGALSPTTAAASSVEILGWIIASLANESTTLKLERIISWQEIVEKACSEENPSSLREAVARSIEASKILTVLSIYSNSFNQKTSVSDYDHKLSNVACRLWLVALTLMQDDDDDIRNIMNKAIAPALEICNDSEYPKNFLTIGTYSIDMMVNNISECIVYSTLSCTDDIEISNGVQAILNELFAKSGHVSQLQGTDNELDKIFQAEQWNVFIEANVCTNVLSKAIGKALQLLTLHSKQDQIRNITKSITTRTSEILATFNVLENKDKGDKWIGGILLQKDVFGIIYSTIFTLQEIMRNLSVDEMKNIDDMKLLSSNKIHPKLDKIIKNILLYIE